ncbi:MAG: hypothetical protein LAP87_12385 [Acidobacteriia bacterium]|nr:hypothetical protein [Terriglobia bacterium]
MRSKRFLIPIALAAALTSAAAPATAAGFGTVVPIGGHASDIALDESRGLLYIANFTANRIEVMSTADFSIRSSMNVAAQPGALTVSPDGQFLLIAHFGNYTPPDPSKNSLTLINLNDNTRQTFVTGDPPLGAAFMANGEAFIVTTTSLLRFDPVTGVIRVLNTFANLASTLPAPLATFPTKVIAAAVSTSADGNFAYGVADNGAGQAIYRYAIKRTGPFSPDESLSAIGVVATPKPLPRLSVAADGSWSMVGMYRIDAQANDTAQFPNAVDSVNVGGNAIDDKGGVIYAQIVTANSGTAPVLSILAADNLTVEERLAIPENITGRSILDSARKVLYTVSDSGVMVLPVGSLNQYHRVAALQRDILVSGSFCDRRVISQYLTVTDPGGGHTDFSIGSNTTGVTISPASGVTPATVQVQVDPNAFQGANGTTAVQLQLSSSTAVNLPLPVRLLVNNEDVDQRGTVFVVSGALADVLADPVRSRFYVLQQDLNQVLVFDGVSYAQIAALRTSTTPTQMAISFDRRYLIVGHDNSQLAFVWDLDTLERQAPILFPAGHYPRSIAASGKALLAVARNITGVGGPGVIDRVDLPTHTATQLSSLGIYENSISASSVLAPAPNGGAILVASPDGNVLLYNANADTFTVSRKDFSRLGGAFAASSYDSFLVDNHLLNASLVPSGTLQSTSGASSGFSFVDQWGFRTTTAAVTSPGVMERIDPTQSNVSPKPSKMAEAPLVPSTAWPFTRTLAPLYDRSAIISLSTSGFTVLPWNYDAAVAPPKLSAVTNAADGNQPVAPGGLISVWGSQMSPTNIATKQIPLPTALGSSCLTINGVPVPMLFVSPQQINGQIPFNVDGKATMTLRTPGGISDNFYFTILPAAPSVFRSGTAGPETGLATMVRAQNNQLVTPTNPIRPNDIITIYATGLGRTSPEVDAGMPAPSDPLPLAVIVPTVTLGGVPLDVMYAGLAPGWVGVYQINVFVPGNVPQGLSVPLTINQGNSTTLNVRVVK